jgi:hypothetical protein
MIFSQHFDVFDYSVFQKIAERKSEVTIYWAITRLTISSSLGRSVAFLLLNEKY